MDPKKATLYIVSFCAIISVVVCCNSNEWQCESGQCIDAEKPCDGAVDCDDSSDETAKVCNNICPSFAFRCAYGACISGNAKCNGVKDCADNSDEEPALCGVQSLTSRNSRSVADTSCIAPTIPNAILRFEANRSRIIQPNDVIENGAKMIHSCEPEYTLEGPDTNTCDNSKWSETSQPVCIKYCPALTGVTIEATCEYNDHPVSCDTHIKPGTLATIKCQTQYRSRDPSWNGIVKCLDDGNWDDLQNQCEPICGEMPVEPLIVHGIDSNITVVPWHVAIYGGFSQRFYHICDGTIISAKVIISAAHCFWDEAYQKVYHKSNFAVAAGKYYRDYYKVESEAQIRNISKIEIPNEFLGEIGQYRSDIAVLVLNDFLRFNMFIAPACIKWEHGAAMAIMSGVNGQVAGWDKTEKSAGLKLNSDLLTISYTECKRKAGIYSDAIHDDNLCVSNTIGTALCLAGSGAGYTVMQGMNNKDVHFLWGVVSRGVASYRVCSESGFMIYTNIQYYSRLIQSIEETNRPRI